jgi:hypothetical protein
MAEPNLDSKKIARLGEKSKLDRIQYEPLTNNFGQLARTWQELQ